MSLTSPRPAAALAAAGAVMLAGCASYEPSPLDLDAHSAAWRDRAPSHESVHAFAEQIAPERSESNAPFDPGDGLSLSEGELVALVFNPDLRLSRLRAGVAAASAEHAGRWDDPQLSIDVLRITESVPNPWIITPGLAFTIPISGRLEAEQARAEAAQHAALARVAEEEWRIRRDVRIAWFEWSAAQHRLRAQRELLDSTSSLATSTDRLAEAGEMLRTEAALFSIERAQREYEAARMRGRAAETEHRLRSLLGLAPDAPLHLTPSLATDPAWQPNPRPDPGARSPTLSRLRHEYEVAEQTLRREIRKQYPDLTIGPLYESDQGQSRIGFLGAIPIPVLNANAQGIAEAQAERELARAAFETEYERIVGAMAVTRARAESLAQERAAIVDHMAPLVDRQVSDASRLLELGESGGLILLESLVRAHDMKLHLIDVRLDEAAAHAQLAFLAGPEPIAPAQNNASPNPANNGEVTP